VGLSGAYDALRDDALAAALAVGDAARALEIVERGRAAAFEAKQGRGRSWGDGQPRAAMPIGLAQIAGASGLSSAPTLDAVPELDLPRLVYAITEREMVRFVVEPGAPMRVDRSSEGRAANTALVDALYTASASDGGLTRHGRARRSGLARAASIWRRCRGPCGRRSASRLGCRAPCC